ncbi:MAG: hypothetical protein PHH11_14585 [Methylomonas sp.]|nr:hypothetical protein [Methylomonas sp.]
MDHEPETAFSIDSEPDTGQRERRSAPYRLKLVGGGLAALLVLLLCWIGMARMYRPQPTSMLDVETRVDDRAKPGGDPAIAPVTTVDLSPAEAHDDPEGPAAAGKQTQPLAAASPQTAELTQVFAPLKAALDYQMTQSEVWQGQQTELLRTLQSQLAEQTSKLEQLTELVNQNTPAKAKPVKRTSSKSAHHKKRRKLTVPFDLVSIDQWGDQRYAVLRHSGQWYEKTIGQALADWRIVSINRETQTLTVKSPQGRTQTLSTSPNANQQKGRQDGR